MRRKQPHPCWGRLLNNVAPYRGQSHGDFASEPCAELCNTTNAPETELKQAVPEVPKVPNTTKDEGAQARNPAPAGYTNHELADCRILEYLLMTRLAARFTAARTNRTLGAEQNWADMAAVCSLSDICACAVPAKISSCDIQSSIPTASSVLVCHRADSARGPNAASGRLSVLDFPRREIRPAPFSTSRVLDLLLLTRRATSVRRRLLLVLVLRAVRSLVLAVPLRLRRSRVFAARRRLFSRLAPSLLIL